MSSSLNPNRSYKFLDEKLPHFFRIMPRFRTELPLPPFISKKLAEQEVEKVLLTSQKGSWEVKIHTFGGKLWFTKGWDDFVLQHRLRDGNFLVFEHNGDVSFKVRMFGPTSCERDFSGESKTNNKSGRRQGKNVCTGQGNPCSTNNLSHVPSQGNNNVSPSQVNIPEHINNVSVKVEVDKDEVPPPVKIQKRDHAHGGRTQGKSAEDIREASVKPEVDVEEVPPPVKIQKHDRAHDKRSTKRKRERKGVNVSSTEQHLQFVTSIKQYNIRRRSPYMHIPADFCVANGLYYDARISLKGPRKEQEVSLKVCRGGKTRYAVITRGWPEFIAGNDLKVGEICTFKLRSTGSSSNVVVFDVEVLRKST